MSRVENAREAQQKAKQQFESALAQFIATTSFSGGELERQYNRLKDAYDGSDSRGNGAAKGLTLQGTVSFKPTWATNPWPGYLRSSGNNVPPGVFTVGLTYVRAYVRPYGKRLATLLLISLS